MPRFLLFYIKALYSAIAMTNNNSLTSSAKRPLVIAHRGASSHLPENTIAAFEAALAVGADGIECDTRLSADGVPVVIHDASVKRTTSARGQVKTQTLDQLRKLDAGGGERIPSLAETAELCRRRALLCIEFKEAGTVGPALEVLKGLDAGGLIFCSFKPKALLACKERRPEVPVLLITSSRIPNPVARWREAFPMPTIRKTSADGLSCHHASLFPARAKQIRSAGLGLAVWCSIEEEKDPPSWFEKALEAQPDAMITAWPAELLEFLNGRRRDA
jgi:glycerophosphoryl diester phosphodiesterase